MRFTPIPGYNVDPHLPAVTGIGLYDDLYIATTEEQKAGDPHG